MNKINKITLKEHYITSIKLSKKFKVNKYSILKVLNNMKY